MHEEFCNACRWAEACIPLAELKVLTLHRPALEADFGWDVFGFIAEAKKQYRTAKSNGCCKLGQVREEAKTLAPEVDFARVD